MTVSELIEFLETIENKDAKIYACREKDFRCADEVNTAYEVLHCSDTNKSGVFLDIL